jgi:DNA-binding MarR family transcriptional regulator
MAIDGKNTSPCTAPNQDIEVRTWVQLVHVYHRLVRRLEQALDDRGLTLAQFEVLARLEFDGAITQNDLAQRLLVSKGNVCGLIDRLEASGLVERKADPADRRANRLFLTDAGRSLLRAALPGHFALIREAFTGFKPGELDTLHDLLERVQVG